MMFRYLAKYLDSETKVDLYYIFQHFTYGIEF